MKIKISFDDIRDALEASAPDLPKYVYPLLNLSNQFAQGTRPKIVGKMSDLIQEFHGKTLDEWTEWYRKNHPDAIQNATDKIKDNLNKLKSAMDEITDNMIKDWVTDLVIVKTFLGLRAQEAILKKIATETNNSYRLANPNEESAGIDGFIGDTPVTVKPLSDIPVDRLQVVKEGILISYKKTGKGIEVEFDESLFS